MTCHLAILHGEETLRRQGIDDPRWNAERLLLLALKIDRTVLYGDLHRELTEQERALYQELLLKRGEHYPLAYLEGTQEFYGRPFHVDPGVLIPRPETEEIIRAVLSLPLPPDPKIVDLGAGSGCIPATLALEIPNASVFAVERSIEAFHCLRLNIGAAHVVRGNLLAAPFLSGVFDVVTANPPYVEETEFNELPAETRWEPHEALLAESVDLIYKLLMQEAASLLKAGGYLVFEIGYGQKERIEATIMPSFQLLEIRNDYRGIPRCFVLRFSGR
jgi:release factor glutamine methyltransferase